MLTRKWLFKVGLCLIGTGMFAVAPASAQCPFQSSYGSGYGGNFGYQNPSFYGQTAMHPYQSSFYGSPYSSPASYFQTPTVPRPNPYASYYPAPSQPVYNTYNQYTDPRHDHHAWHPGHFLMGHY